MPQDPPERVDVVARRSGLLVPGAGRERRRLHADAHGTDAQGPVSRVEAVRRVLEEHAHGDGEEGRDPYTLGHRHRRLRGGEWRGCEYTGRLSGQYLGGPSSVSLLLSPSLLLTFLNWVNKNFSFCLFDMTYSNGVCYTSWLLPAV